MIKLIFIIIIIISIIRLYDGFVYSRRNPNIFDMITGLLALIGVCL